MFVCILFLFNVGKCGSYSKVGKVRRLNLNWLCREGVRLFLFVVIVEFVLSKFVLICVNIIFCFFFYC